MNYLYKLFFFDPAKTGVKRELYLASSSIDFITHFKQPESTAEGTRVQLNIPAVPMASGGFISHVIDGLPENCNQIVFDGLFFKCTVQYVSDNGMKRYTSWLNPNNICCVYSLQPDCSECFFFSGARILLSNKLPDIMTALRTHNQKYKERKNQKYGKEKK
jgi:hypothetical protein